MSLYEVECIIDKRYNITKQTTEYKVKWQGYPQSQSTWEPLENLEYVEDLVEEYELTNGKNSSYSEERKSRRRQYHRREKLDQSLFKCFPPQQQNMVAESEEQKSSEQELKPQAQARRKTDESADYRLYTKLFSAANAMQPQRLKDDQREEAQCKNGSNDDATSIMSDSLSETEYCHPAELSVLQMAKNGNTFIFLIEENKTVRWMTRNELIKHYPQALIEFYERHIEVKGEMTE